MHQLTGAGFRLMFLIAVLMCVQRSVKPPGTHSNLRNVYSPLPTLPCCRSDAFMPSQLCQVRREHQLDVDFKIEVLVLQCVHYPESLLLPVLDVSPPVYGRS